MIDALAGHLGGWALASVVAVAVVGGLAVGVFLALRTGRAFSVELPFGLGKAEVESLSRTTAAETVPEVLEPDPSGGADDAWRRHANGVEHDRLFGVDTLTAQLAEVLTGAGGNWILSLYGIGGAGKTAVAFDVVGLCRRSGKFDHIVWASAKNAARENAFSERDPLALAYWQDVIGSISSQLGLGTEVSRELWEERLHDHIEALSPEERILLVVDNLEGLEDVTSVVDSLQRLGLRQPHRLLLTSRHRERSRRVVSRMVPPLKDEDALAFVRHLGVDDPSLVALPDRKLGVIAERTEGNPFLIKLVVRTYLESARAIDMVLGDLSDLGNGAGGDGRALGHQVRDYLFTRSLNELEGMYGQENVVRLIGAFGTKRAGDSLEYRELQRVSGIQSDGTFAAILRSSCRMSLVRPSQVNKRYSIHSLLYDFTTQRS
ncbi:NB-ARC domain-containing protein [Streptomyces sp. SPB162]|uniref:NB-ARC domain-containing protein n=1 Tax=Streptomyces sp. SPB162 TaxID=2940560 RepID=UPI00240514E7|nr:NB-ARC domain-containing protein [Streptomyces sp. SPB162]MDF9817211.1 hypothetical protein [Streptomyces sp. SPB162]